MLLTNTSIDETHTCFEEDPAMIEMYLLEQLDAVARFGTLLAASEHLHITQPSMSRAMKKLEDIIGVELFEHRGNRLVLNEYGKLAADYARRMLDSQEEMVSRIRALERSKHTILMGSCAPGPLMELPSILSSLYPEQTISTETRDEETLLNGLRQGIYQMIILIHKPDDPDIRIHPCGSEHLCFNLPKGHRFTGKKTISFAEMDGESFLMASEVGVWGEIVRQCMPNARFLLQGDTQTLREVVRSSSMSSFVTDLTIRLLGLDEERVCIPISDDCARMPYWCCCRKEDEKKYLRWYQMLERRNS